MRSVPAHTSTTAAFVALAQKEKLLSLSLSALKVRPGFLPLPSRSGFGLALRIRHASAPLIVFESRSPGTRRHGFIISADRCDF